MTERGPVIPPGLEATYRRFRFAPAYRAGNTVYVSGIIGTGDDGKVPEALADECAAAFAQMVTTLEHAGSSVADIVDMTSFHTDLDDSLAPFMAARNEVIDDPYPAWTAIGCTGLALPGARVEVKVTAVLESDG